MTGTEKQIAYANSLLDLLVESYGIEINKNADNIVYTDMLSAELWEVLDWANEDGCESDMVILWFKDIGNTADFLVARSLYRKWEAKFKALGHAADFLAARSRYQKWEEWQENKRLRAQRAENERENGTITNNDLIARVIREGIVEVDGYRYVCHDWEICSGRGVRHEIVRINLEDLNCQYELEQKTADEITGWENVASVDEMF